MRPAVRVVFVVSVAACGSDPAPDAIPDAAPRCDPSAPFAAPVPVDGLNSALDDVSARLLPDELTVVFSRKQATNVYDLYQATRDARDVAFATPELLATVNSVNSDLWPTMTPDGLTLMFDSDRGQPGIYHVYVGKRASTTDRFATATSLAGLMNREINPFIANSHALYFNSPTAVRTGAGMQDLWRAELNPDGSIGTPIAVIGGVNSIEEEVAATLTDDELRIFFRRTIGTEPDIYTASRSTVNDGFGVATPVANVTTAGVDEVPTWVSADGCNLYLFSNAAGGLGGADIYVARRGTP